MTKAVSTLALWVTVAAPSAADQWERIYPISGRPEVRLRTSDGSVRVDTWDKKSVGIRVLTHGWRIGERGVQIVDQTRGDHVAVEAREPSFNWSFGVSIRSIEVEVLVPRESDLDIQTGDGSVTIRPMAGHISVGTADGRILVDGLKGDIRLHTGDGSIRGTTLEGKLSANTGDGRISVDGRFDALDLKSGDGSIQAAAAGGSRLTDGWEITTADGPVVLRVPSDLKADLDIRTGDGRIDVDLPVQTSGQLDGRTLRGTMNGGGGALHIRTGDGAIRLEKI